MRKRFSQKHPAIASILWALLLLSFYTAAGTITAISKASEFDTFLIRAVCVFAACILSVIYIWKSDLSFSNYGFNKISVAGAKKALSFVPLFAIEVIPLFAGFKADINFSFILIALAFTLCVGFAEEVYFRGIIFNILKSKGLSYAIIVSSVIFGIDHMGNLMGGAGLGYTFVQVIFAFLFGLVCAEIVVTTKSIIPVMIWHFIHDFLSFTTSEDSMLFNISAVAAQSLILIIFSIYLFKAIKRDSAENIPITK